MKVFDDYGPFRDDASFHQEVFRNDQRYSETDVIEAKFNDVVEDSLFAFPGPEPPMAANRKPRSITGRFPAALSLWSVSGRPSASARAAMARSP